MAMMTSVVQGMVDDVSENVSAALPEVSGPLAELIEFVQTPIEFGFGAAFTTYFQGVAFVIAGIIIIVNGIRNGYLMNGGTQEMSTGAYIWRSLWPLALIASTPTLVSVANLLVRKFLADLIPVTATDATFLDFLQRMMTVNFFTGNGGTLLGLILLAVILYYWCVICFQIVKRMLQLSILSTLAPLIAAFTAADSTSGDFATLFKEIGGIALIVVMQIAAFQAAMCYAFSAELTTLLDIFLVFALFSAVKQMPSWIQRYTLSPVVSRGDNVFRTVTGASRSAFARITKPQAAPRVVSQVGKAIK